MIAALFLVFHFVTGVALSVTIQRWDRRRLSPEERAWVWNAATWGSAVYNFGVISLVAWGYVTRSPRYVKGLAIGVELALAALFAQGLLNEALGRIAGLRGETLELHRLQILGQMGACVAIALVVALGRFVYEAVRRSRRAR
ncbi:MAG: hypothetical protein U0441_18785 [Polyangiaceae bacterium]